MGEYNDEVYCLFIPQSSNIRFCAEEIRGVRQGQNLKCEKTNRRPPSQETRIEMHAWKFFSLLLSEAGTPFFFYKNTVYKNIKAQYPLKLRIS